MCNRIARGFRIACIIDKLRRQRNRFCESSPELLFERSARNQLAVFGSINLITRRAAYEPHLSWLWKSAGCGAKRQRCPRKGEHRIGHCYVDATALPAPVARAQGK